LVDVVGRPGWEKENAGVAVGPNLSAALPELRKNGHQRHLLLGTITARLLVGTGLTLLSVRSWGRKRVRADAEVRVRPPSQATSTPAQGCDAGRVPEAVQFSLLYAVPPVWLAASLADWACHRYSRIERTAGVKESLIHLLLLSEMGLPVLATVFLEITSPVILLMIAAFLIHEVTTYADLRIATCEREVTPTEQMVHSFMEKMPLIGIWLVIMLREEELRALLGAAPRSPDFSLRPKEQPLPVWYRAGLLAAIALLGGIPYVEELWRTLREASPESRHPGDR
jgi:hypothetical protein